MIIYHLTFNDILFYEPIFLAQEFDEVWSSLFDEKLLFKSPRDLISDKNLKSVPSEAKDIPNLRRRA